MSASPEKTPAVNPQLPQREYPFAHDLREGLNRSHRRIDLLNLVQAALLALAALACIIGLLL